MKYSLKIARTKTLVEKRTKNYYLVKEKLNWFERVMLETINRETGSRLNRTIIYKEKLEIFKLLKEDYL